LAIEMEVDFGNSGLEPMEQEGEDGGHSQAVGKGFRKVLRFIRSAVDERDFRAMRSLNFEALKGDRAHQYSFRITIQWRLIVEIQKSSPKNIIRLVAIEDYH
jgi:proteic killer suppression protein